MEPNLVFTVLRLSWFGLLSCLSTNYHHSSPYIVNPINLQFTSTELKAQHTCMFWELSNKSNKSSKGTIFTISQVGAPVGGPWYPDQKQYIPTTHPLLVFLTMEDPRGGFLEGVAQSTALKDGIEHRFRRNTDERAIQYWRNWRPRRPLKAQDDLSLGSASPDVTTDHRDGDSHRCSQEIIKDERRRFRDKRNIFEDWKERWRHRTACPPVPRVSVARRHDWQSGLRQLPFFPGGHGKVEDEVLKTRWSHLKT